MVDAQIARPDADPRQFVGGADDLAFAGWEVPNQPSLMELAAQIRATGLEVRTGSAEDAALRGVAELIKFSDPSGVPTVRSSVRAFAFSMTTTRGSFRSPQSS